MKSLISFVWSCASRSSSWLIMASATKSSIWFPKKMILSFSSSPITSPSEPLVAVAGAWVADGNGDNPNPNPNSVFNRGEEEEMALIWGGGMGLKEKVWGFRGFFVIVERKGEGLQAVEIESDAMAIERVRWEFGSRVWFRRYKKVRFWVGIFLRRNRIRVQLAEILFTRTTFHQDTHF